MITKTKFKQTEMGKNPEDWEEHTLGEFIDVLSGFAFKSSDFSNKEGIPIIKIKNITPPIVSLRGVQYYNRPIDSKVKKYIVRKNDILISMTGSNVNQMASAVGKIARYNRNLPALLNQRVGKLIINDKTIADEDYVYLFVSRMEVQYYLAINASGSANQANISPDTIESIKIVLPSLPEQIAIAKILSDIDSKIELNHQMNKTLEAIGHALFKHWFVDFEFSNEKGKPYKSSGGEMIFNEELGKEIPEGWDAGEFSELVDYKKDSLKAGESLKDRKYVPIDTLPMKKMGLESYKDYTEAQSSLIAFEKDDILFGAMRPYFHRVNISPFSGVTRTTCFVLRPKKPKYLSYSILLLFQDSSIDYANAHSTGSTIPYAVWNNSLEVMPVLKPKDEIIQKFDDLFYPTLSKIRDSIFEMQTLSQIRDSLLPKLMSGKIRVPVEVE